MNLNLDTKPCKNCKGTMKMSRENNIVNYTCECCGRKEIVDFQNKEESKFYVDMPKREYYIRLRQGLLDWETTNWSQLFRDFENFITNHEEELKEDLQFQMVPIACLTHGYHVIDLDKYKKCKKIFAKIDKIYRARLKSFKAELKISKAQSKKRFLSNSMEEYRASRVKYIELRNEFLRTKTAWKLVWKLAKYLFNKI